MKVARSRERAPLLYRVAHAALIPPVNALYRPWTEGLEHIPDSGPAILASNHLSALDSVFLPAACRRPIYFLGKSDYFHGWRRHFFERVGVMPVAREGGSAAEAGLRKGQQVLEAGRLLGIYPEGTRSPDGRLYRGKTGPVRLALRSGAPLIPVAMVGTYQALPAGMALPKLRGVGIRVGAPLDLGPYRGADNDHAALRRAADQLMYELMMLSGQDYVDEYSASVKDATQAPPSGRLRQ